MRWNHRVRVTELMSSARVAFAPLVNRRRGGVGERVKRWVEPRRDTIGGVQTDRSQCEGTWELW